MLTVFRALAPPRSEVCCASDTGMAACKDEAAFRWLHSPSTRLCHWLWTHRCGCLRIREDRLKLFYAFDWGTSSTGSGSGTCESSTARAFQRLGPEVPEVASVASGADGTAPAGGVRTAYTRPGMPQEFQKSRKLLSSQACKPPRKGGTSVFGNRVSC